MALDDDAPDIAWQTCERNEAVIAQELVDTRSCDWVGELQDASFFDDFFQYLRLIDVFPLLEALDPKERVRATIPHVQLVLLMMMRCIQRIPSMAAMTETLLTDEVMMSLVGFNAMQIKDGVTKRGLSRRHEPVELRGPVNVETIADNISALKPKALEALFNGAIACLAKQRMFPVRIDAILDASDIEATPTYKMDGCDPDTGTPRESRPVPSVTREKRPDIRNNRHATKIDVTVFGWKVWVVFEATSKIPLAIKIDDINVPDNRHALAVLQQAQANVAGMATIVSVAIDRGFIDGKLLAGIDELGIYVHIPAKSNLLIAQEARSLANQALEASANNQPLPDGCVIQKRVKQVTRGHGKHATIEHLTTSIVGVSDLDCDFWGKEGSSASGIHKKDFVAKRLRATVVFCWDGHHPKKGREVVLLTSDPTPDPWHTFDLYDDRSLIENTCFREAKEKWFLEHHPQRSESSVHAYTTFVFLCMALFQAYRWQSKAETPNGLMRGFERFRRALEVANRNKVIVFSGNHYGIFKNWEFALMAGLNLRAQPGRNDEPLHAVLARYGAAMPNPSSDTS